MQDVDLLRREIWGAGISHPDPKVRSHFVQRYPTFESFDSWSLKEFLGFNPDRPVLGLDAIPDLGPSPTVGTALSQGARHPDDDRRNQERFAHDGDRRVRLDPHGNPFPADPVQLDMGPLRGTASQAYAHYGLPKIPFSDDPDVLRREPRRFAYPPTARAFAAEFAQMHSDLALCAATLGRSGGVTLGWLFLGNAHHYIEDVANQIHTLQAIFEFFVDAKIESYKEELRSLGGLLRSRPTFVSIGVDIIKNHHLLAEELFAKRVREHVAGKWSHPGVEEALGAILQGDSALEQALDARKLDVDGPFARYIAEEVIDASSREGAEVYRLIRRLAQRRFSRLVGRFETGMDPDEALVPKPDQATLAQFYRLQGAGFARAGSALRRHVSLYSAALELARASDEVRHDLFKRTAERLVSNQVAWLKESAERLARFQPRPPRKNDTNWWVSMGLCIMLLSVDGMLVLFFRWRVRKYRT
ncbi:MAG: hypothetical protein HY698_19305 [Deltaproteobacteria bacterium]|nr:hypothetical protein [Deltaproteobacteria bacterium]